MSARLILAAFLALPASTLVAVAENPPLELVEVRALRKDLEDRTPASRTELPSDELQFLAPSHPSELFARVPGAWISRGSGQEHLTALRSPVLTGPGACGAFLVLEDGVPIRPAGFCNVNGLFELNLAQAARVDVIRGPAVVIDGSNGLHGVISSWTPSPGDTANDAVSVETGSHDYLQGRLSLAGPSYRLAARYTDAGSFRADEDYRHGFLTATWSGSAGSAQHRTSLAAVDLDQNTAGYLLGQDAYRDTALRRSNANPEAFREASAVRLVSRWSWQQDSHRFEATPYLRSSTMDFLQHFLPGKPLEENSQVSAGLRLAWLWPTGWSAGLDVEWARGELSQFQAQPLTEGSPFLQATRPAGFHYDYSVTAVASAAWGQFEYFIEDNLIVTSGIRYEFLRYRYDNRMRTGNTRDDGTACGFGGCLYTRPSDRSDRFSNLAPELGLRWRLGSGASLYLRAARGFRAPQATELYRLQNGQEVSDLDTTTLDTLEAGYGYQSPAGFIDISVFSMRKRNYIFRDAQGFNVSEGKTTHRGLEIDGGWSFSDRLELRINAAYARHRYAFDRAASQGETIRSGNDIDTAPRWMGGLRLVGRPAPQVRFEAEWSHMGDYFLDAANRHRYGGHTLLNLRAAYDLPGNGHSLALRLTNALDRRYAERADYAFGNYRYFPGAGRQWFLNWRWQRRAASRP